MSTVPEPCGDPVVIEGDITIDTSALQACCTAGNDILLSIDEDINTLAACCQAGNTTLAQIESDTSNIQLLLDEGIIDVNVVSEVNTTFAHGQNTDIDIAAAEQVVVASTPSKHGVIVKALPGNTGTLYVGLVGVTTSTGFPLQAGDTLTIPVDDANKIYAATDTDNQGIAWVAT